MNLSDELKSSRWLLTDGDIASPVISLPLDINGIADAHIALGALGFAVLYVNGQRVGDEYFLPFASIYHERDCSRMIYPIYDSFTYRAYYTVYDISPYLHSGANLIEIQLGGGFYRQTERVAEGDSSYGMSLGAIFAISVRDLSGERVIHSSDRLSVRDSAIRYCELFIGEVFDARYPHFTAYSTSFTRTLDLPQTLLTEGDSEPDRIVSRITPVLIHSDGQRRIYDTGVNISGFVTLRVTAPIGSEVHIRYAENIDNCKLDFASTGSSYVCSSGRLQIMEDVFISDGAEHIYEPTFVWHAFRYFEIEGEPVPVSVAVIHADTDVTSHFESSSAELNFLYNTFIRTQLNNMHTGFPSDCPHRERLGYTGDGQVCSLGGMTLLDSQAFYRKWIRDIFDSQDRVGGHINHTAPFAGGGGGPGGWGCAAVLVPYNYYKTYGDIAPVAENYEGMLSWISYLVAHSDGGLVTAEEEGGWSLGDWCTPEECRIPEPLVNSAYLARSLECLTELAAVLGREEDIPYFTSLISRVRQALVCEYLGDDGSLAGGIQGADAYAVFAGLGIEESVSRLAQKYSELSHFDTGFLGTYILTQILFESGNADVAYECISSHGLGGYGHMMDSGATSFYESWHGDGSHDHPMFGAPAVCLLTHMLGIGQRAGTYGYESIVIRPSLPSVLEYASGSIMTVKGRIAVSFRRHGGDIDFEIELPEGKSAVFKYAGREIVLDKAKNSISIKE